MILSGLIVSTLLWANLANYFVWTVLLVMIGFGLIGFYDDYLKVTRSDPRRLLRPVAARARGRHRVRRLLHHVLFRHGLFRGDRGARLSTATSPISAGPSRSSAPSSSSPPATRSTSPDGLDGLAIVPVMIAAGSFGFVAYLVGNAIFAKYLGINFVIGAGDLAVVCGALIGAGAGFLWFNAPPAQIFMGDTGSLALGGLLGTIAVAVKHEIVLVIVGGLFVLEAVSVIVQVVSFKLTGKRVFRMAPIHHHFEQLGWSRAADRHPLLDHRLRARADRALDPEAAVRKRLSFRGRATREPGTHCGFRAVARRRAQWVPGSPAAPRE